MLRLRGPCLDCREVQPEPRLERDDVTISLNLSDRLVDMAAESFDCAVRVRPQPDSTTVARLLENAALVVVASPDGEDHELG